MPELPEVEVLTRAVRGKAAGAQVESVTFFSEKLREAIPQREILKVLQGEKITNISRRSKYLLLQTAKGTVFIHLGMTGNVHYRENSQPELPHTHYILGLSQAGKKGKKRFFLHYHDPRRFGRIGVVADTELSRHPFFQGLGPEPLEHRSLGKHLFLQSRGRRQPVKSFLMDSRNVVGIGNIYAAESLFQAGIAPSRAAGGLSLEHYQLLARYCKRVLRQAIAAGGSTISDFSSMDGQQGYFSLSFNVYGRAGEACKVCGETILNVQLAGRSSFFCPTCQSDK